MKSIIHIGEQDHEFQFSENRQLIKEGGEWYSRIGYLNKLEAESRIQDLKDFIRFCISYCELPAPKEREAV